jgi:hypothetical protein
MTVRICWFVSLIVFLLVTSQVGAEQFNPHVLVYAGRIPGYAEALAEIINETGTTAIIADSDTVMRSLTILPQTGCVVIAALNPSDFVFLREFAPVFTKFFQEGGSFVGLGACCSEELEALSTIFPILGNATERGKRTGSDHGSVYVLSEATEGISDGLPQSFIVTQEKFTYRSGIQGGLEPSSEFGDTNVVYRDEGTGYPLLMTLEGTGGGRTVSMPGCFVVGVDRLPFYWGRLVSSPDFRTLLKNCVSWAMSGSKRFNEQHPNMVGVLEEESSRLSSIRSVGEDAIDRANRNRTYMLIGLWTVAIIFQGFLVLKFILPRFRPE